MPPHDGARDDGARAWLAGCPDRLRPALLACATGEAPANVALLQLLMAALSPEEAEAALVSACAAAPGEARARLAGALGHWRDHPQAYALVKRVLQDVDHGGTAASVEDGLAHWAAAFDRMAARSPEGSVALYALGNPDLLRAATAEIVGRLADWGLIGPDRAVLDLGCGIGRMAEALSPLVGHVTGIDLSRTMIAQARRRCASLSNVTLRTTAGRDLSDFGDASFDLVLAVDVFPYLVQTGPALVRTHVAEAARVLRPAGSLVILNMSYRGDLGRDRAELAELAEQAGFRLARNGTRDFSLWDGATFQLVRRGISVGRNGAATRRVGC